MMKKKTRNRPYLGARRYGAANLAAQAAAALVGRALAPAGTQGVHPEGCLSFDLFLGLGADVMVDVVVVDVLCALPAHEGPGGAQGQGDAPLVRSGDARTRRPRPDQRLETKAGTHEGLLLGGAGAGRAADDDRGLAPWGLQNPREVIVQDGLGVFVG